MKNWLKICFLLSVIFIGGKCDKVSLICPQGWRVNNSFIIESKRDNVTANFWSNQLCANCCPLAQCNRNVLVCGRRYRKDNFDNDDNANFTVVPLCSFSQAKICNRSILLAGLEIDFQPEDGVGFSVSGINMMDAGRLQRRTAKHNNSQVVDPVELICPNGFDFYGIQNKIIKEINETFSFLCLLCIISISDLQFIITISTPNQFELSSVFNKEVQFFGPNYSCDKKGLENSYTLHSKCYFSKDSQHFEICGLRNYTQFTKSFNAEDLISCNQVVGYVGLTLGGVNLTLLVVVVSSLFLILVGTVLFIKCKHKKGATASTRRKTSLPPPNPPARTSFHQYEVVEETEMNQDCPKDPLAYKYTSYDSDTEQSPVRNDPLAYNYVPYDEDDIPDPVSYANTQTYQNQDDPRYCTS